MDKNELRSRLFSHERLHAWIMFLCILLITTLQWTQAVYTFTYYVRGSRLPTEEFVLEPDEYDDVWTDPSEFP
ncbi:hypothetical protein P879_05586 [Paragonimus westermani]|uniref:Uncharacterized protein n=1 Tax=Paragonimus westermani TaxID=34504 RepID=A0A8T0DCW5_9TREM|nr:hypothetical protein P879_05586 [Paragonimus westermani]